MNKIARFCGILCTVGMCLVIVWKIIRRSPEVLAVGIVFAGWAFFGYTIYSYSGRQGGSNLDFQVAQRA
ncbi:MAG: hypothetical protein M3209_14220 [Acidobacteriota bacterium]|nr:hypothetical protein [Acidobacteriota bacterium]